MYIGIEFYLVFACGVLAIIYALSRANWLKTLEVENKRLTELSNYIRVGANAFLKREYMSLVPFVLVVAILLSVFGRDAKMLPGIYFMLGALTSSLAGFFGMRVATMANSRTTEAAEKRGLNAALTVAFSGGSVMGMTVVGLALIGLFIVFYTANFFLPSNSVENLQDFIMPMGTAFSLGASSVALFFRVGGGIYTKAADVAADLVGKVEAGIPEDDPRNPAVIADNVGDNVGDVAGMGADLFESYVGSIVGCMILALTLNATDLESSIKLFLLPLIASGLGIIASVIGSFFVRVKDNQNPHIGLNRGSSIASILSVVLIVVCFYLFIGDTTFGMANEYTSWHLIGATLIGLVTGVLVGKITEYFTATDKPPVDSIVEASQTGSATNIISGISVGMSSTFPIIIVIGIGLIGSYILSGMYGIGISSTGMLMTLGIQISVDAYGPIADNAGGLAEMASLAPEVREITDQLDSVGNTTAAIGKGFAIGSATLTSIILFSSFKEAANIELAEITNPYILVAILIGAVIPFLFSSLTMNAVGKAAFEMINEVRRQFSEFPEILTGEKEPDYHSCVDISTKSSIREMILPALIAILSPLLMGWLGGKEMLLGFLAGATITGVTLSIFMSNSGGAWDNAKKTFESDDDLKRNIEAYNATVIGDTVGDPFKDTAGPSLNILIKLMSMVALVIAPMI